MFNNYGSYGFQTYPQNFYQPPIKQENNIDIRFGTLDEAKAHLVAPNKSAVFVDRTNSCAYVKSVDSMGNPMLEGFKITKMENTPSNNKTPEFDTKDFVKQDDIKDFVTTKQLKNVLDEKFSNIEADMKKLSRLNTLIGGAENDK